MVKLVPEIASDLKKVTAAVEAHRTGVAEPTRKASYDALTQDVSRVLSLVDNVLAVQTQARLYLIELPVVDVGPDAVQYARENRLDLQNQLAQVTDSWRRVTVAANALRSDVNVVATANIGTDPDHRHPLNFASEASTYSVGLQIDGPLNRQAERNAYRASLIAYQRAKREYVALSDQIEFQIRNDLRQLERLRLSFEINRQQVLSAARQVENSRLELLRPRQAGQGTNTITLSLLQAYNSLLQARNALAANYINYEQQRVRLLINLEALQLDQRGFPTHVSRATASPVRASDNPAPRPEVVGLPETTASGRPAAQ
jgi:outer membrane protein TolC